MPVPCELGRPLPSISSLPLARLNTTCPGQATLPFTTALAVRLKVPFDLIQGPSRKAPGPPGPPTRQAKIHPRRGPEVVTRPSPSGRRVRSVAEAPDWATERVAKPPAMQAAPTTM